MHADPVCGKTVPRKSHAPRQVFQGQAHYFCSKSCAERFQAHPERWVFASHAPSRSPKGARR